MFSLYYFAPTYYPSSYFAPGGLPTPPPGVVIKYFPADYFAPTYFAPTYFPGGATIITTTPVRLKPGLIAALRAEPSVLAITANRVTPNALPRTATRPAVIVRIASDQRGRVLAGHTRQRIARVLIECQAPTDLDAEALARAVDDFLEGYTLGGDLGGCEVQTCLQVNEVDSRDNAANGSDTGIFRRLIDYRIVYYL